MKTSRVPVATTRRTQSVAWPGGRGGAGCGVAGFVLLYDPPRRVRAVGRRGSRTWLECVGRVGSKRFHASADSCHFAVGCSPSVGEHSASFGGHPIEKKRKWLCRHDRASCVSCLNGVVTAWRCRWQRRLCRRVRRRACRLRRAWWSGLCRRALSRRAWRVHCGWR
jgi:hypothetical protein